MKFTKKEIEAMTESTKKLLLYLGEFYTDDCKLDANIFLSVLCRSSIEATAFIAKMNGVDPDAAVESYLKFMNDSKSELMDLFYKSVHMNETEEK